MNAARSVAAKTATVDVLSPSSASQYLSCSAKWYFKRVLRLNDPPTAAVTLGSAIHTALAENFSQKIETGEDLPAAGVRALYRKAWDEKLPQTEFRDDEDPAQLKSMGEALTLKYLDEVAPSIEPAGVEVPVCGNLGGVFVRGTIDLLDTSGQIIDLKSSSRKPTAIPPEYRFQVATYTQLTPGASGEARVDTLVKTARPQIVQQPFRVDEADIESTEKLYPLVQHSVRAEVFTPNRVTPFCSRRYCAFWRACQREFGGKVGE